MHLGTGELEEDWLDAELEFLKPLLVREQPSGRGQIATGEEGGGLSGHGARQVHHICCIQNYSLQTFVYSASGVSKRVKLVNWRIGINILWTYQMVKVRGRTAVRMMLV